MSQQPSRDDGSGPSGSQVGSQEHSGKKVADSVAEKNQSEREKETESRLTKVESKVSNLEGSLSRAVGTMMPKVDALLSVKRGENIPPSNIAGPPANPVSPFPAPSYSSSAWSWLLHHPSPLAPPSRAASPAPSSLSLRSALPLSLLQLAERGDSEGIFQLMEKKNYTSHMQLRTQDGDTALHVAAGRGYVRATVVLLGFGMKVDTPGHMMRTPLHCAAAHGHPGVAQRLLDMGAQIDAKDVNGATSLEVAIKTGHCSVVELFLEKGVPAGLCDEKGDTLLVQAAKAGQWKVVELLLKRGASATECKTKRECALVHAVVGGQGDAVRMLLKHGAASVPQQVKHAVGMIKSAAAVWAFVDVMPDAMRGELGQMCWQSAARDGRLEALKALLEAGVNIETRNRNDQTALHLTARFGHPECLKELVRRGADVHAKSKDEDTPLHKASRKGKTGCAIALLEAGASITETNKRWDTPLDVARTPHMKRILRNKRSCEESTTLLA